ncbi:unnamed protein product [Linum tenue]|uniref:Uncharacterized protein n=1 Tax=Linum tenue TaxID=586396 RepID=A0AAV0NJM1_9ROSI|nr:unnamed protein product [Linum tenue]
MLPCSIRFELGCMLHHPS